MRIVSKKPRETNDVGAITGVSLPSTTNAVSARFGVKLVVHEKAARSMPLVVFSRSRSVRKYSRDRSAV
jgi:hypothetical protein